MCGCGFNINRKRGGLTAKALRTYPQLIYFIQQFLFHFTVKSIGIRNIRTAAQSLFRKQCTLFEITADTDLATILPPVGNGDFYRITFTGPSEPLDLYAMKQQWTQFPNLLLRDRTTAPVDIWGSAGEDTLEGMYFKLLRSAMEEGDDDAKRQIRIAAQISRQILDGQEVVLP
jgi:hypothetical protein